MQNRLMSSAIAMVAMLALGAAAHAEVKKYMNITDGKMLPFFRLVTTPPKGWIVEEQASKKNGVEMFVPRGKNFGTADAVIYVMVDYKPKDSGDLSQYISDSHESWRKSVPDTKITEMPAVERANGKPAFRPYQYENPSRPQQAFEYVAFGEDGDKDGNTFNLKVVITGRDRKAIETASASYLSFLAAH